MLKKRDRRSCFIIGPMRDAAQGQNARLRVLAREVVAPLMREIGGDVVYEVITPYDLGNEHIMRDVIYALDRADIVRHPLVQRIVEAYDAAEPPPTSPRQ